MCEVLYRLHNLILLFPCGMQVKEAKEVCHQIQKLPLVHPTNVGVTGVDKEMKSFMWTKLCVYVLA